MRKRLRWILLMIEDIMRLSKSCKRILIMNLVAKIWKTFSANITQNNHSGAFMKMFRFILSAVACAMMSTPLAAMESNAMQGEPSQQADPAFILFALHELSQQGLLTHDVSLLILQDCYYLQTLLLESKEYQDVLGFLKEAKTHQRSL